MRGGHLGPEPDVDVRPRGELVDEVAGHALLQRLPAIEDGHAPCMGGEEHRRLAGRVPGPEDVHVKAVGVGGLAARRAVEEPLAHEAVEALDRELAPGDPAGEDDRPRPQDVAAVEVHLVRRRIDPRDATRDQDLGAEPARLLERAARQLVARHARGEAEVVLDARRRPRLPARRLPLDHERPEPFRRAVHGGRETRRAGADDDRVVLRGERLGGDLEELCHAAQGRPHHRLAVHDPERRVVAFGGERAPPLLGLGRHVRLEPPESDLVAIEEPSELGAGRVPPVPEDDRPVRRRLRRERLEASWPADPLARQTADVRRDLGGVGSEGVVVVRLDPDHPRGLRRPEPRGMGCAERDRDLAEEVAGPSLPDHAPDAVRHPDGLDPPLEKDEQGRQIALVHRVLAGVEREVGCDTAEPLEVFPLEGGEGRDLPKLLRRHHPSDLVHPGMSVGRGARRRSL